MTADPRELREKIRAEAARLGFDQVGFASAVESPDHVHLKDWIERGDHAGMAYMERQSEPRRHPGSILDGVRTVVMVSLPHGRGEPSSGAPAEGRIARYAQGADYHEILWDRLGRLLTWLQSEAPGIRGRAVADTAPLLERDYARRAGLGWIGKNTLLISRRLGSFTTLGALLLDVDLPADPPHEANHCGTCRRCLDACPTDAFRGPNQLDAMRCLSYWTIEHKGEIPDEIAENLGEWVFGCDICQDVCPWNRKAPPPTDPDALARPEWRSPDLLSWLAEDPESLRKRLKGTALARAKRKGLVRNALYLLGARAARIARPAALALIDDPEPVVRAAARWALDRIDRAGDA